jgi:hypothetical protein
MENTIKQLLNDLDKLTEDIDTLDDSQRGRVFPLLHDTLDAIKNTDNFYEEEFLKPLVRLSEEVINIRLSEEPGVNKKLTIPCYDLFLPFKARKLEAVERIICPPEMRGVINEKVDEINQKLQKLSPRGKNGGNGQK